jgi:ParB family chromosome partitioning protein
VADSRLTASHARALLVLPLAADQEAVAALAIAEGLNVRDTERAVQDRLTRAAAAPRPRAPSAPEEAAPDDVALRRGLEHALGVPVRLQRRKGGGGRIVIDWAEDSDLDALYRKLGGPPL